MNHYCESRHPNSDASKSGAVLANCLLVCLLPIHHLGRILYDFDTVDFTEALFS